jgi:hypothetical protein
MATVIIGGTPAQRKILTQAATSFLKKLIPGSESSLEIEIKLIRDLHRNEGCKGDLLVVDDDEKIPNEFEIRLDSSMNLQALIRALAHEMVHVKQYVLGELRDSGPKMVVWKGKKHVFDGYTYWGQPWEIEAYGRELGLVENFVRYARHQNRRWYRDFDYHK